MRLARQHTTREKLDVETLPRCRSHCQHCQGERVFFLKPRTRFSPNAQWICFACRQPKEVADGRAN